MGIGSSSDESVEKHIKDVLQDCGITNKSLLAIGDFATALKDSPELHSLLVESFTEKKNTKCTEKASKNVNIRTMEFVLRSWMTMYPNFPIPKDVKKELQRLTPRSMLACRLNLCLIFF